MKSLLYFDVKYFKQELKSMLGKAGIKEDILAGITVACVAIPLSLAIAMASNVSPGVGLTSAIIGSIIAAIFGGTRLAVTGPTATMAVIISSCVSRFGMGGLLVVGLICGLLQLSCGLFRLGRYAKLVPLSVISAFTAGIGFIIFVGQLPKALQLPAPTEKETLDVIIHISYYLTHLNPLALMLAIVAIVILKVLPYYSTKIPVPLVAVVVPTFMVYLLGMHNIDLVGAISRGLPLPQLPNFSLITNWSDLFEMSFEVFLLASLETLLSSSAVDGMGKGDLHNPSQELIGQGLANIGVTLFGAMPVTGVIARSSVNIAAGAVTRRSAIVHALVILGLVYLWPSLIGKIPVAALAGVLLGSAMTMMNLKAVIELWKQDRTEFFVYVVTFVAIISTDLIEGVKSGIMVAFLIVALRMLTTRVNFTLWANKEVLRINLGGSMTFWSFDKLDKIKDYVLNSPEHLKFVLFDFEDMQNIDQTGAMHLLTIAKIIKSNGTQVILHDLDDKQLQLMEFICPEGKPYITTTTENEVKQILEAAGVSHSADDVLRSGMKKFLVNHATQRKALMHTLAQGQNPHTLLISCSDSRVNPNTFLSAGLGELFIVRNVGNVIPPYGGNSCVYGEWAAIEYALLHLHIRNIVICGHTQCGAISACVKKIQIDSAGLKHWLGLINNGFAGDKIPQDVEQGVRLNLLNQLDNLKSYPLVASLLKDGELKISLWIYEVKTASILEYDVDSQQFDYMN
jgi:carbonic anhydrase